jgi:hypothetical protein
MVVLHWPRALPLSTQRLRPFVVGLRRVARNIHAMVRIAISQAAIDAVAKTLPLGSVGYENKLNEKGERLIWLDPGVVDRLRSLRGPGERATATSFCGWRRRASVPLNLSRLLLATESCCRTRVV